MLLVRREHLDRVAAHPELVAREGDVVALVRELDEACEDRSLLALLAAVDDEALALVLVGGTEPVDRGHGGDDDHVPPAHDRARRRVAEPVDLVVDRRVLLDVGVGRREVRLGLVVVVVGDEVLDPVLGEQLTELAGELRGEALVRREHDRGALDRLDHPGDRERLPRAGDAEQRLVALPRAHPGGELGDRLGLIACSAEVGDELESGHDPLWRVGVTRSTCSRATPARRGCAAGPPRARPPAARVARGRRRCR